MYGVIRNVACVDKNRNAYRVVVWKSEGNRPLGRLMHTRKDINMDYFKMFHLPCINQICNI